MIGQCTRRRFLTAAAAAGLYGAGCNERGMGSRGQSVPGVPLELGRADEFAQGITDLPLYRVRVLCRSAGAQRNFSTVSMVCTHQTCIVNREPDDSFSCPCHGSRFDGSGNVLVGPAVRALPWYGLSLDGNGVLWVHFDRLVGSSWSLIV